MIKSKVFQINIQEEVNSMQPAVVLKLQKEGGTKGLSVTGNAIIGHRGVKTTYFNETMQI